MHSHSRYKIMHKVTSNVPPHLPPPIPFTIALPLKDLHSKNINCLSFLKFNKNYFLLSSFTYLKHPTVNLKKVLPLSNPMTYNRGLVARASRWWGLLTNPLLQSTETHMFSAGTNTSHHTSIPFFVEELKWKYITSL